MGASRGSVCERNPTGRRRKLHDFTIRFYAQGVTLNSDHELTTKILSPEP